MSFNFQQDAYRDFRETLKQRTSQVVVWTGAGLSAPAGLPSWQKLKDDLIEVAHRKAQVGDNATSKRIEGLTAAAENEPDSWQAFEYLKQALQDTSYRSAIRSIFSNVDRLSPPDHYQSLWQLGVTAFITLNIDRFAHRSHSTIFPGKHIREFDGISLANHMDSLRAGLPFILNLHGNIDNDQSWVFSSSDLAALRSVQAYKLFLESIFLTKTVLFIGISADDMAVARHLECFQNANIKLPAHYWVTNRNDAATLRWAERFGVQTIIYNVENGDHKELGEMFTDLSTYIPVELAAEPVLPPDPPAGTVIREIPPIELERSTAEEIRLFLNHKAKQILRSDNVNRKTDYELFWIEYDEAIYRAWSISTKADKNQFLGKYRIKSLLKRGGFGEIYIGESHTGRKVAVKILHGNARFDQSMMDGFRRGVSAMKILSDEGIQGMVPYIDTAEIPTCAVMDFVEGPDLEEAISTKQMIDWDEKLSCAFQITEIIGRAHLLPQRILHRDIRPANIMLQDYWPGSDNWRVVMLDFDLSWHRDASGYSVPLASSTSGYLAPEQLGMLASNLTRNALVDSYGLGMTFFFIFSGKAPSVAMHRHTNWQDILEKTIGTQKCERWVSAPRRLARLIDWATKDTQSQRWDIARIRGELDSIGQALKNAHAVHSAEFFAEEIIARAPALRAHYTWDIDKAEARVELRSGFVARVAGDDSAQTVRLKIEWINTGDRMFKNVSKYIGAASERCCAALKKGAWHIDEARIGTGECNILANIYCSKLRGIRAVEDASKALLLGLGELRME